MYPYLKAERPQQYTLSNPWEDGGSLEYAYRVDVEISTYLSYHVSLSCCLSAAVGACCIFADGAIRHPSPRIRISPANGSPSRSSLVFLLGPFPPYYCTTCTSLSPRLRHSIPPRPSIVPSSKSRANTATLTSPISTPSPLTIWNAELQGSPVGMLASSTRSEKRHWICLRILKDGRGGNRA